MTKDESTDSTDPESGPFELRKRPATPPREAAADAEGVEAEQGDDEVIEETTEVGSTDEDTLADGTADEAEEAVEEQEASDSSTEPEASTGSAAARVGALGWVLLAVAVAAVVMTFLSWRGAHNDPDRDRAALRDQALIEGTNAVETMTTMDHRDVAAGIKAWQSVSTGVLHDQLVSVGDDEQEMLASQGKVATGRVVQSALTDLTDRTATLIAAVEVTVKSEDDAGEPAVKRNRFSADLVLVSGTWKIENLQQVAVNV